MTSTAFDWNEQAIAELRQLWDDGLSCSQIAAKMGCPSRRSVIGKVHRLGLKKRRDAYKRPIVNAGDRSRRNGGAVIAAVRAALERKGKRILVRPGRKSTYGGEVQIVDAGLTTDLPDRDIPVAQRKTLMDLGVGHCKWPIGDPSSPSFFFCGADKAWDRPYCHHHTSRAYSGLPQRRQQREVRA